ncbi:hypothetical protein FOXYS1_8623 [Fusarium oxysporum]|uniref:Mid2 domain-containing protein n=1 Tax=Fusarium oxysporum TaxID=5507 RepID=A0A8H5A9P8_FUSOX|nr:hypothetical protein FOXYS1_8623 [Fusarium oxysporum]
MHFSFVLSVSYAILQPAMAQEGVFWGVDGKQWISYCCSEDDPGCCAGKRGVFLDSKGNIEDEVTSSTVSLVQTTSSAETVSSTITDASVTASSDPSPTSDETEETNTGTPENSQGMKIGLGVGVPAATIISGLSVWLFLRKKTAKHQNQSTAVSHPATYHYPQSGGPPDVSQAHLYQQQYPQAYEHYPEVGDQRSTKSPPTVQELQG